MKNPFFTIGHSTRTVSEFVDLLRPQEVRLVVDVRTVPRSRTNPQFNRDTFPESLAQLQIGYEHVPQLGGLRGKQSSESSPNMFWTNQSFLNYADYALTEAFRTGFDRLLELGAERRCAIMCAEAVWWRCHRRIITDDRPWQHRVSHHVQGALGAGKNDPGRQTRSRRRAHLRSGCVSGSDYVAFILDQTSPSHSPGRQSTTSRTITEDAAVVQLAP